MTSPRLSAPGLTLSESVCSSLPAAMRLGDLLSTVLAAALLPCFPLFAAEASRKNARSLSALTLIRFENHLCRGRSLLGTCVSRSQCTAQKGIVLGSCALGIGVCCAVIRKLCGDVVGFNNTYFVNPEGEFTGVCRSGVLKMNSHIRQFRLFFASFVLDQPDSQGLCSVDNLTLLSESALLRTPAICGFNTGQHMHVDSDPSSRHLWLSVSIDPGSRSRRFWNIQVSQMTQWNAAQAPESCLQYFTGVTGSLRSFNWSPSPGARQLLSSQDYSFCVRVERGFCSICLEQCEPAPGGWNLDSASPDSDSSAADGRCAEDFLSIPCGGAPSQDAHQPCLADRFCGGSLHPVANSTAAAPVCTRQKPFIFRLRTNDRVTNPLAAGFCANYVQHPC